VSAPTPELAAAQAEIVRLRVGLQGLLHAAAVESLHDGNPNAVRAKFTAMTTQIEQLLGIGAGDPAWAAASAGELTAALNAALAQRSELRAEVALIRSELQTALAAAKDDADWGWDDWWH